MQNQVAEDMKSERLDEILRFQDDITIRKNRSLEGTVQEILIEGESDAEKQKISGRTRSNKIVNTNKEPVAAKGAIINVEITKARKHSLEGLPVGQ